MAKRTAKKKSTTPNQPIAVLYGLDAGTPRGDAVRSVLADQGIRVRSVGVGQLADPVGAIVGMTGFRSSTRPFEGEAPDCEFMLLHNVGSAKLSELLAAMRAADCSVGCKAQVTQHNRLWPLHVLISEVAREHAALGGK